MIELLEKEMPWELRIKDHKTHEELKKGPFDIQKLKSEVKNPFFQFLIKEYETFSTQENLKNSNDYYFRMMDELYSVRNSFLHSGEVIDLSIVKLKYIIPFLISRTRDLLYLEIERDDSFEDIVRYLFSTGKALI